MVFGLRLSRFISVISATFAVAAPAALLARSPVEFS